MTNLRNAARGENCEVRSPVCNFNPETTVLAHYRLIGISGAGMKSPDLIGAHACSDCHDLVDGRRHIQGYTRTDVQLLHLQGVVRTQAKLIQRGYTFARGRHEVDVEMASDTAQVLLGEVATPLVLPRDTAQGTRSILPGSEANGERGAEAGTGEAS